jgi:hypothetical protein
VSEQAPEGQQNPEKKLSRLFDNCNNCEEDYDLTPDNTTLHLHEVNPDCNFLRMTCDHCDSTWVMFGIGEDTAISAMDHGIDPIIEKYPNETIVKRRMGMLGLTMIEPVEITARHEALVGRFGETLQNCPDELLYAFITDENEQKPYPQRWN